MLVRMNSTRKIISTVPGLVVSFFLRVFFRAAMGFTSVPDLPLRRVARAKERTARAGRELSFKFKDLAGGVKRYWAGGAVGGGHRRGWSGCREDAGVRRGATRWNRSSHPTAWGLGQSFP